MEIRINRIKKSYSRTPVLNELSLSLSTEGRVGLCVGIAGLNGSGKSTLLSILAGICPADSGEFWVDGRDLLRDARLRQMVVGYVPQGTPLIEELSAYDNLRLYYSRGELTAPAPESMVARLGVTEFLKKRVSSLSGGMKKRLSIACAVSSDPDILIMDEPTASLDPSARAEIGAYINHCRESGKVVLLSTHLPSELKLCDLVYVLKNGVLSPLEYTGDGDGLGEMLK